MRSFRLTAPAEGDSDDGNGEDGENSMGEQITYVPACHWRLRCPPGGAHAPEWLAQPLVPLSGSARPEESAASSLGWTPATIHAARKTLWDAQAAAGVTELERCAPGLDCDASKTDFKCSPSASFEHEQLQAPPLETLEHLGEALRFVRSHEWIDVDSRSIPGSIASHLRAAGLLPDPGHADNEFRQKWLGHCDFEYSCRFDVEVSVDYKASPLVLRLGSIDTMADIFLNGEHLKTVENQFVRHEIEIPLQCFHTRWVPAHDGSPIMVVEGRSNDLVVRIRSPAREVVDRASSFDYPIPTQIYPFAERFPNLLRKSLCNWGWDWGPTTLSSGLLGPVELIPFQAPVRFSDVSFSCSRVEWDAIDADVAHCDVTVRCDFDVRPLERAEEQWEVSIGVSGSSFSCPEQVVALNLANGGDPIEVRFSLRVTRESLWWPRALGAQNFCVCSCVLRAEASKTAAETRHFRAGLRHVELRRVSDAEKSAISAAEDIEEDPMLGNLLATTGESFEIAVNGRALFCKGANWIPVDNLLVSDRAMKTRLLLQSCLDANFSMVRVWGGGLYESDLFYRLCDEFGLLVWQDAMFACACFPAHEAFLSSVETEVRQQVRRLSRHPCVTLVCGNNENEEGILCFDEVVAPQKNSNARRYFADYNLLAKLLARVVEEEALGGFAFWPSSPSNGSVEIAHFSASNCECKSRGNGSNHAEGCLLKDQLPHPNTQNRGDNHFWGVWYVHKSPKDPLFVPLL
jgi:beta-mannosidase